MRFLKSLIDSTTPGIIQRKIFVSMQKIVNHVVEHAILKCLTTNECNGLE